MRRIVRLYETFIAHGAWSSAALLERLNQAFDDGEITREEFRYLIEVPMGGTPVNAPGGDA